MSETTAEAEAPDAGDEAVVEPVAAPDKRQETESRARDMGWRPLKEWNGPASRWVDAGEFVDRAQRILPLQNERLKAQEQVIRGLRQQLDDQGSTLQALVTSTRRAEQIGYKRAMRELEQQRESAIQRGDTAAFKEADQQIKELGPEPPPPSPPQQPVAQQAPDPVVQTWVRRNSWFQTDPVANVAAVKILDMVAREYPNDTLEEQLVEVENRIRQRFPEHFATDYRNPDRNAGRANGNGTDNNEPANNRRSAPPMVHAAGSNPPPRAARPNTFEAMPAEVKAQFDRQKRMLEGKGEPLTKEEFARYYYEQFEDVSMPWQMERAS